MRNAFRTIIAVAVLALSACAKDPLVVKTEAGLVRGEYEEGMLEIGRASCRERVLW